MSKPGYANQSFWIRLVFMLFYWCVLNVAITVFGILLVVVSLFKLVSRYEPDISARWLQSTGAFIRQTFEFLSYNNEEKPFPFQPWPKGVDDE